MTNQLKINMEDTKKNDQNKKIQVKVQVKV